LTAAVVATTARIRITSASGKQFPVVRENGPQSFERERAA
jgi:hypothetical protein